MSKRKTKPRRDELAATYGKFVLLVGGLLELRDVHLLSEDERKFLDAAYSFASDARNAFDKRTGARTAWNDEWADRMKVRLVDDDPAPIVAPVL